MRIISNTNTTWGVEADKLISNFNDIESGRNTIKTLEYETPAFIKASTPTAIEPDFIDLEPSVAVVYAKFDRLADAHKPFFRKMNKIGESEPLDITKLPSQTDHTIYDINLYELAKTGLAANAPKIILIAGVHGYERTSVFALYYVIRDVLENATKSKILTYIKNECRILIVPLMNPWGYQNDLRENGRNVDLNRNFDNNWEVYEGSKGTAPFSEAESFAVKTLVESNSDAFYLFDFHSRGWDTHPSDWRFTGYVPEGDAANLNLYRTVIPKLNGLYTGQTALGGTIVQSVGSGPSLSYWCAFVKLLPASNPECVQSMNDEIETLHSLENNRQHTHYLGLLIQHVFNVYDKLG